MNNTSENKKEPDRRNMKEKYRLNRIVSDYKENSMRIKNNIENRRIRREKKEEANKKRKKIVIVSIIILVLFVVLFVIGIKVCNKENISADNTNIEIVSEEVNLSENIAVNDDVIDEENTEDIKNDEDSKNSSTTVIEDNSKETNEINKEK